MAAAAAAATNAADSEPSPMSIDEPSDSRTLQAARRAQLQQLAAVTQPLLPPPANDNSRSDENQHPTADAGAATVVDAETAAATAAVTSSGDSALRPFSRWCSRAAPLHNRSRRMLLLPRNHHRFSFTSTAPALTPHHSSCNLDSLLRRRPADRLWLLPLQRPRHLHQPQLHRVRCICTPA